MSSITILKLAAALISVAVMGSLAAPVAGALPPADAQTSVANEPASRELRSPDALDAALRVERAVAARSTERHDFRSPDAHDAARRVERAAAARSTQRQDLRSRDTIDGAEGYEPVAESLPAVAAASPSSGFDWVSAAIGAGAGTGLLIVLWAFSAARAGSGRRHHGAVGA